MAFSRYRVTDAYTLEELRREYQTQDAKGRIGLLERLYGDNTAPPGEIILMAVEDLDVNVRQWIARHGQCLERDSIERLKSDSDPFVRARLRENPTILTPSSDSIEWFHESNHFERLALVRNNDVSGTALIEKIFDGDDQELGLNLQDRKELILAYLTNDRAISESHKLEVGNFIDGLAMVMTRGHFSKLWELISKRPKTDGNVQLQHSVYRYLGATDDTKADIYRTCDEPGLRQAILENCTDDDIQTLELGMKDVEDGCRQLAYEKLNPRGLKARIIANGLIDVEAPVSDRGVAIQAALGFVDERLQSIVKGNDKAALRGLARNKFLPVEYLRKVIFRLDELDDHFGVWMARETLEDTKKTQAPNDPQELFGEKGNFLEDKIDFVGRRILYYEAQLQTIKKRLTKAVIALAVIWLGWKLFVWYLN